MSHDSPTSTVLSAPQAETGSRSVLVVGASMAGLSAAAQLSAIGYQITVVERAPQLRLMGSPIDVRGEALEVAKRMGILDLIRANKVASHDRPVFTTFVDASGEAVAQLPLEMANDSVDDIEVSREALIKILNEQIDPSAEFIYEDWPTSLDEDELGVAVTLASGLKRTFDIVVAADGIHSSVRRLLMGPESLFCKHLGAYYAIFDLPIGAKGVSNESRTYNSPQGMAGINDYGNRCFGAFSFRAPEIDYDFRDPSAQKQLLIDAFADERGWHVPYLLEAASSSTEIYFDSVSQVHMPRWSKGRVVFVGDAAHAASLFSGRGTSLAMLGTSILADELVAAGYDHAQAFDRYEARLRPTAHRAQEGVMETRDFIVPVTQDEIDARNRQFPLRILVS